MASFVSKVRAIRKTIREHRRFQSSLARRRHVITDLTSRECEIQTALKRDGIYVIENYYYDDKCDRVRDDIDRIINTYSDTVWKDRFRADNRTYGADRVSPIIHEFIADEFINRQMLRYQKSDAYVGFVLAARLDSRPGNTGSGGGTWHRDNPHGRQFKAILYISDVGVQHGPFQYWKGSHRTRNLLCMILNKGAEYQQYVFPEEIFGEHIESQQDLLTLTGKKGTLILVDTRGLHRGSPIESGSRYALTNYYYKGSIPDSVEADMVVSKNSPVDLQAVP